MLQQLRKSAGTWIVKLLMLLLVASFALWGMESYIGGSGQPVVAEVGDRTIDAAEFEADFRRQLSRLQQQTQQRIDADMAKQLGLHEQLLQQQVDRLLLAHVAAEMNLRAPDDVVRALILQNPVFQSSGQFDQLRFQNFLAQAGMGEAEYVAAMRDDLRSQAVAESVMAGEAPPPKTLSKALLEHVGEKRRAAYLVVPKASVPLPPAPEEAALRSYYEAHPEAFTAPELRAVSWIELSPEVLAESLELDEQSLRDAYAQRRDSLNTAPTRSLRQVVVDDEAAARAIAEAAASGAPLAQAAADAGAGAPVELGAMSEDELGDLLGADFAAAVFAAEGQGVLQPLQGPLGWNVVEVTAMTEGAEPSFEEVRDRLAAELKRERAADQVYSMANQVEDLIAGGARLGEIAETMGLPSHSHPGIDATGRTIDGMPADIPPATGRLRRELWRMEAGAEPETLESDAGGSFVVTQLDTVSPPQLRPFEDVKDQVLAAWTEERRAELAADEAARIAREVQGGTPLVDVAAGMELPLAEPAPFTREGMGAELPFDQALLDKVFEAPSGETVTGRTFGGDAAVVQVREIVPATGTAEADGLRQDLERRWSNSFRSDLVDAFRDGLAGDVGVTVHRDRLDRLI